MTGRVLSTGVSLLALALLTGCDSGGPTQADDDLPGECTAASARSLSEGEGVPLKGANARRICIDGGPGGAEFVLVTFSAATSFSTNTSFSATGENLTGIEASRASPSAADPMPAAPGPAFGEGGPHVADDREFHIQLRERERRTLTPLVRSVADPASPRWAAILATAPAVGSLMTLNAQANQACSNALMRTGRVEAVSLRAIVVADTLNPQGGFERVDYEGFAAAFDSLVGPVAVEHFGGASDIDGNGRVILFYTQEVNRLSEAESDFLVGGFFFARDLFPRSATSRFQACPTSNEAELLYLLVPDPDGTINGNERPVDLVRRFTLGTTVHEYQHLINAAQRLHIIQSQTAFEELWLNEALSHAAEELLFFRASGMSARQNIGLAQLQQQGSRAIDAINRHHLPNIIRLRDFMEAPENNSPYNPTDGLATRGASRHFLRYALDRSGGNDAAQLRGLVSSQTSGFENLASTFGSTTLLQEWLADWAVVLFADDRVANPPPRYRDRSWNHASLFEALDITPYPLRTVQLGSQQPVQQTLRGGGAAYLRFRVEAGEVGLVEITSGGATPPETLRVTLLRTR